MPVACRCADACGMCVRVHIRPASCRISGPPPTCSWQLCTQPGWPAVARGGGGGGTADMQLAARPCHFNAGMERLPCLPPLTTRSTAMLLHLASSRRQAAPTCPALWRLVQHIVKLEPVRVLRLQRLQLVPDQDVLLRDVAKDEADLGLVAGVGQDGAQYLVHGRDAAAAGQHAWGTARGVVRDDQRRGAAGIADVQLLMLAFVLCSVQVVPPAVPVAAGKWPAVQCGLWALCCCCKRSREAGASPSLVAHQ
jgi:hypothetical protein